MDLRTKQLLYLLKALASTQSYQRLIFFINISCQRRANCWKFMKNFLEIRWAPFIASFQSESRECIFTMQIQLVCVCVCVCVSISVSMHLSCLWACIKDKWNFKVLQYVCTKSDKRTNYIHISEGEKNKTPTTFPFGEWNEMKCDVLVYSNGLHIFACVGIHMCGWLVSAKMRYGRSLWTWYDINDMRQSTWMSMVRVFVSGAHKKPKNSHQNNA